jgi:hypothetical protein
VNVDFGIADVIKAAKASPLATYKIIGLAVVAALLCAGLNRVPEDLVIWTIVGSVSSYLILVTACALIDLRKKGK